MVSEIYGLLLHEGVGHAPLDPRSVSLNTSYHNEQQYTCIWFKRGVPNSF